MFTAVFRYTSFSLSKLRSSKEKSKDDDSSNIANEIGGDTCNFKNPLDFLSDEDFSEWFRGFVDAEGNFLIQSVENRFKLIFSLCLHKDEIILLKYLAQRLGVGNIYIKKNAVFYTISSKNDLLKILSILDKQPLNTSKNLNYILFRQAYDLYFNRKSIKVAVELNKKNYLFKGRNE